MQLTEKVALVTGGAKRVGKTIALTLAREGVRVIIHANTSINEAEETRQAITDLGKEPASVVQADLSQPDQIEQMMDQIRDQTGGQLDILINSASTFHRGDFLDTSTEQWDHIIDVNLRAPFLLTQGVAKMMIARGQGGAIINIGDEAGLHPWKHYAEHSISKAGLTMLTKVTAKALAEHGIRVNMVVPGPVMKPNRLDAARWQEIGSKLPLGKPGSADVVAQVIVDILRNDFMTGSIISVDGGSSLLGLEDVIE